MQTDRQSIGANPQQLNQRVVFVFVCERMVGGEE